MEGVYNLVRILPDGKMLQIAPSLEADSLIIMGKELTVQYPEFCIRVISSDQEIVWTNENSTPISENATSSNC